MKFLAVAALFIAGALAVPAGSYPPPPPPDYGGDHGGYSPVPTGGGGYGSVPPTPTPPPPPSYDDGGSDEPPTDGDGDAYEPPADGDGDSSDGGDDGDDGDGGSDGSDGERSGTNLCPALISGIAKCCSANVLGLVNLDCVSPNKEPKDRKDFEKICAGVGKQATCCTVGLLGLGLLCGQ
ncbi:fungal hydrophobin domain-containing protein [Trichoderma pleuroticola]